MAWVWPLSQMPQVTHGFGGSDNHPGTDLPEPGGTPFLAAGDGTVIQVGADGFGPNAIYIQHPNGIVTVYGHGSAAYVKVGDKVTAGQTIGAVGTLGISTGNHLHFEVQVNGQRTDPMTFLQTQGASVSQGTPGGSSQLMSLLGGGGGQGAANWDSSSLAASLGLSKSLFDSDPELQKVLATATSEQLDPSTAVGQARFTALLQNTKWYKTHTDQQRKWILLSKADPAEARQQFVSQLGIVMHTAAAMGVGLTTNDEWVLASQAAQFAWTDDELKYAIAAHFTSNKSGLYGGDAGKIANDIRAQADAYGMPVSAAAVGYSVSQILNGKATQEDYINNMKNYASGMFPAIKDQIMAGKTVKDIAQPYLNVYQNTLERSPDEVNLAKDRSLRQALNYTQAPQTTGDVGKPTSTTSAPAPQLMPLWQYEQQLKDDPRWLGTDNAQKSLVDAGVDVLKKLGLSPDGG